MKVSEVTVEAAKEYCGISGNESDSLIMVYIAAAKAFIVGYTGLTAAQTDEHEDITIACLCLVNDMFTQRGYAVDKTNLNPIVSQILGMHSVNYL